MTDQSIVDHILVALSSTHITSAYQVLQIASREAGKAGQKHPGAVVRDAVMRLLPGPDQVWDTDDDIIDKDVAMDLSLLMETKAFNDITSALASQGVVQKVLRLVTSCL
jgi:hypothetical protein